MTSYRFLHGLAVSCVAAFCVGGTATVRVRVEEPKAHAVISAAEPFVTVRGYARGAAGKPLPIDLMLVLDVSRSTRLASGADVDGDGVLGETLGRLGSTDPQDTVLHAEVAAARALLAGLSPEIRVGLVSFSGASDRDTGLRLDPSQEDAWLRAPVGAGIGELEHALDMLLEEGPHGATNFEAAIRLATKTLARQPERPDVRRAVLFLTDGLPSFPVGRADVSDPGDVALARAAAIAAAEAGLRIHVFALGPDAVAQPASATELARRTGGSFVALAEPGRIIEVLPELSFEGALSLVVRNLETGSLAEGVTMHPDGVFEARAPVIEGLNRIRVEAGQPPTVVDLPIVFRRTAPSRDTRRNLEIRLGEDEPPNL